MTVQLMQVDWTSQDATTLDDTLSFTDLEMVTVVKDSGAKESHATIVLKNYIDRFVTGFTQPFSRYNSDGNTILFKEGDFIKIYGAEVNSFRAIDTTDGSADLLMTGEIGEVKVEGKNNSCKVTLVVFDKTYVMLNRLFSFAYTSSANVNAPEIIQKIVRFVTDDVSLDLLSYDDSGNYVSNGIQAVDARLLSAGGFIEDTRQDASVFPDVSIAKVAKPAYEWIKELSTLEYTNDFAGSDDADAPTQDRNMLFYIDENNKFHWYYPRDVSTTTLNGAINDSVATITVTDATVFATKGTVFIGSERIDYTGVSSNDLTGCTRGANNTDAAAHSDGDTVRSAISIIEGDTTSGYTLNSYSLTKKTFDIVNFVIFNCGADMFGNGITSYFFDRATKSKTLKDTYKSYNDIAAKLMQEEIDATNIVEDNTTSSAFNFKGNRYKVNGSYPKTTSWGVVVANNTAYNNAFRAKCITSGIGRAEALTARLGSPRWKGTMNFQFHRFTAGEVIEFTSTRAGINKQALRIMKVIYNFTKTGASVQLTMEEDEDKLT